MRWEDRHSGRRLRQCSDGGEPKQGVPSRPWKQRNLYSAFFKMLLESRSFSILDQAIEIAATELPGHAGTMCFGESLSLMLIISIT